MTLSLISCSLLPPCAQRPALRSLRRDPDCPSRLCLLPAAFALLPGLPLSTSSSLNHTPRVALSAAPSTTPPHPRGTSSATLPSAPTVSWRPCTGPCPPASLQLLRGPWPVLSRTCGALGRGTCAASPPPPGAMLIHPRDQCFSNISDHRFWSEKHLMS